MERRQSGAVGPSTYFFGALGGLLFGYDLGIVAGAILFITPHFHLGSFEKGEVTSSLLVGAMVGALLCGPFTDRIGRKRVMLTAGTLFGLCAIGDALAPTLFWLLAFRALMGLAVGAISVTVPVYLSEIAPARVRGTLAGLFQLAISSGILIAYLVSLALKDGGHWRLMLGLAAAPALLLLIGTAFQPESPRWLISKGRESEAREVLAASRTPDELEREIVEIRQVDEARSRGAGLLTLLADPRVAKLIFIGGGLALLQQVSGVNTIIYYAPTILKTIGYSTSAAIIANAGLGGLTVAVTLVMLLFVVDRVGRRTPLIIGAIGMAAAMALLAILFYSSHFKGSGVGWVAIVALAGYKISYSLSWGGLVWIMLGEMFPLRARGPAMGVATMLNWLGNFLVALLFPTLLGATGTGTVFVLFGALCLLACVFAIFFIPETKGSSLEELEERLGVADLDGPLQPTAPATGATQSA